MYGEELDDDDDDDSSSGLNVIKPPDETRCVCRGNIVSEHIKKFVLNHLNTSSQIVCPSGCLLTE